MSSQEVKTKLQEQYPIVECPECKKAVKYKITHVPEFYAKIICIEGHEIMIFWNAYEK